MLPSTAQSMPPVVTAHGHPPVLHVTGELAPYSGHGPVGQATAGLARAQAQEGFAPYIVTPLYAGIDPDRFSLAKRLGPLEVAIGARRETMTIYEGLLHGSTVPVYFLSHPCFRERKGSSANGIGDDARKIDSARCYALLCRGALELAHRLDRWPRIVHGHDWQGGMALLYAKIGVIHSRPKPHTVMTVHNAADKGLHPKTLIEDLGLGWDVWGVEGVEFFEQFSYLKAGASYADLITTVSPRYARDIQTEPYGGGLHGYFQVRRERLVGVPHGIDGERWSPSGDPHLPHAFGGESTAAAKAAAKAAVQREVGLPIRPRSLLALWNAPYSVEKGIDLVIEAGDALGRLDAQILFLGEGEPPPALLDLVRKNSTRMVIAAPTEALLHRAVAGADLHLLLAALEPSGMSQLYGMPYGTVPLAYSAGGLDEVVVDFDAPSATGNGFKLADYSGDDLVHTLKRAIESYKVNPLWQELVHHALDMDVSWEVAARRYGELYGSLLETP